MSLLSWKNPIKVHKPQPTTLRPFLKWAGGKYRLVPRILAQFPSDAERYVEPFVGSGAVFASQTCPQATLADINRDLIELYEHLRQGGDAFIAECMQLFIPENNTPERFYGLRDEFNQTPPSPRRSQLFVYLNRHAYNGLCRYNAKGGFNVPFGRYKNPYFPLREMRGYAQKLAGVAILAADFRDVLAQAGPGDLVYCDPPYIPLSTTANFTSYASASFGAPEQQALAGHCRQAAQRGAFVVISNHDTPVTRELYQDATSIESFMVGRSISCHGAKRDPVPELLAIFTP